MEKINFQSYPNTTTPINDTNLNQLQTNVENSINPNATVDANGWTVLTFDNYKEYLKKGTVNKTVGANEWAGFSFDNLPENMQTLGNNFLTASVHPSDGAFCCSIGALPTSTAPKMQIYNAYGQQLTVTLYYSLRIIELSNE